MQGQDAGRSTVQQLNIVVTDVLLIIYVGDVTLVILEMFVILPNVLKFQIARLDAVSQIFAKPVTQVSRDQTV
jgi:hypothetical protein